VGVVGAAGKMGTAAIAAIRSAGDLELTAIVTRDGGLRLDGAARSASVEELDPGAVDVLVDLTVAEVARRTIAWACEHGTDAVIGTSGLTDGDLAEAASAARASRILVVPNFSIGAVLLTRFAVQAAGYFDSVEIIELHHDRKRDAPSGTSIATASALAAARRARGMPDLSDPTVSLTIPGSRGAAGPGGVRVHSVRLPGLLAHQEVHFGSPGEGLVLRHDSYDRASFMPGLVLALRRIDRIAGVQVGLEHVLDE
jgi:4-hydroxy-tetrahydrodipicolinate reductase